MLCGPKPASARLVAKEDLVIAGLFVVETVFSVPGLGRYFIQSIQNRDYPLIMGTTIFLAAFIIFMNFLVDVLYVVVDPRIKLEKGGN